MSKRKKRHVSAQAVVAVPRPEEELGLQEAFGLELNVASRTPEVPTVEVGWCLLPGTVEYLHKRGVTEPYILLVTIDENEREIRQLFPVKQGMAFWAFTRPGTFTLHAMIVFVERGQGRPLEFLSRDRSGYHVTLFAHDQRSHVVSPTNTFGHSQVRLILDEKCFAKEPPKWLKTWVNLVHDGQAEHECHFRKRAIFAFTIQPWPALVYYASKVIVMIILALWHGVVFGNTKVDVRAIWPIIGVRLQAHIPDMDLRSSFWMHPLLLQISPIALAIYAFLGVVILNIVRPSAQPDVLRTIGLGVICGYAFTLLLVCLAFYESRKNAKERAPADLDRELREAEDQRAERARRMQKELDYLVCRGGIPRPVSVSSLPREHRTLDLRFAALKAKLCRQFAR